MGVKQPDKPSKYANKLTKKLFKGKKGKAFQQTLLDYMQRPNPPTGPAFGGSQALVDLLVGGGGSRPTTTPTSTTRTPFRGNRWDNAQAAEGHKASPTYSTARGAGGGLIGQTLADMQVLGALGLGNLVDTIARSQAIMPQYTEAVQQGLSGNFFDITPFQEYAERALRRETMPTIAQTFSTLGSPLSSDFTGQTTNAIRDTYLNLAAQDAAQEFAAKNALVNQGGLQAYMQGILPDVTNSLGGLADIGQVAPNLALGAANQLANLDTMQRATQQSTQPGAAQLFPSWISGPLSSLSQISSAGRIIPEV